MTDYEFCPEALERDGWITVWPLGAGIGRQLHERSWPEFVSVLKYQEYFAGAGKLAKLRRGSDVQEELARRYLVVQQHVWNDLQCDELIPHILASPVPAGTQFTKFTVRAQFVVQLGATACPGIDHDAAVQLATADVATLPGVQVTGVRDTVVGGDPAVVVAGSLAGPDAALAERRAVVVHPSDRGVVARLLLHTDFQDAATRIDEVLALLLDSARITKEEPSGVEA